MFTVDVCNSETGELLISLTSYTGAKDDIKKMARQWIKDNGYLLDYTDFTENSLTLWIIK